MTLPLRPLGFSIVHIAIIYNQLSSVWVQVVALVGPSGGGKSSIVKLVERFYLPSAGAVRMDGRDVGIYDEKWLRRRVAIVSQEPVLYGRRYPTFCCSYSTTLQC